MRLSPSLLIVIAWVAIPIARAQTATKSQPAAIPPAAALPGAGQPTTNAARPSWHSPSRHQRSRPSPGAARGSATAGKSAGVLELGATDITGNKELPKVMVIVPWKGSLGADGVVKPADSLLNEVLEPVDRGVFQRQIHYYGQLDAKAAQPAAGKLAPVGDSH